MAVSARALLAACFLASARCEPGCLFGIICRAKPKPGLPPYALQTFTTGEVVEAKGANGQKWLLSTVLGADARSRYHIRVGAENGELLPAVPARLLRRRLGPGERDFLVDNTLLNQSGLGLKARREKRLGAVGTEYAPWGSLVTGTDEGDGWLRLGLLTSYYLPMKVKGVQVIVPAGRNCTKPVESMRGETFVPGEHAYFQDANGQWHGATVVARNVTRGAYRMDVMTADRKAVFPVQDVGGALLRKVQATPRPFKLAGQLATCKKGGCMSLTVKMPDRDVVVEVAPIQKVWYVMSMSCRRRGIPNEACAARTRVTHAGRELKAEWPFGAVGITEGAVLTVEEQEPQPGADGGVLTDDNMAGGLA